MIYMPFKKAIISFILLLATSAVYGQDMVQFNHYIANQGLLNPAYNGTRDVISGLLIHRSQWVGFDGAPMNQALNVHGPIEDTNLGVGVSIMNDNIGFSNNFDAMAAASYKLMIDREKFLSFGLQLGVSSRVYDGNKAITEQFGDPLFNGKESKLGMNVGFGTYFYGENYFAGFSVPKMFSNNFDEGEETYKNTLDLKNMHMYLYGGYVIDWDGVKIKPTLLLREVYGAPLQFDVSANVLVADALWLGLSYRSVSEMVFLSEYVINRQFTVRYSFDYALSSINKYAKYGSHEIGIQFDFTFNKRAGMRSIRYF
ncbi:type IX secretion system membrane protein, PorP/SprF family [Saccharicrinis carchari]|uniref:Type IX secretion system membrane protein, PorP/SprF family n=1 Tax=Saccharicrinis carchari TaxID=1168039 RepID=A0A521BDE5_SACCC|nr:type IX secretion system membrane protein PorP/SprF [Saccharicrinis carchari]SMO45128.1 type IX secretion system membrane protein, PorP/SprF family [Saccharicrinis carchari]